MICERSLNSFPSIDTGSECELVFACECERSVGSRGESTLTYRECLDRNRGVAACHCHPAEVKGIKVCCEFKSTCQLKVFGLSVISDSAFVVICKAFIFRACGLVGVVAGGSREGFVNKCACGRQTVLHQFVFIGRCNDCKRGAVFVVRREDIGRFDADSSKRTSFGGTQLDGRS